MPEDERRPGKDRVVALLNRAFVEYQRADDIGKEQTLDAVTDADGFDPDLWWGALNSAALESHRSSEPFLLLAAYVLFVKNDVPHALALCEGLWDASCRRSFLVDLIARCLVEKRDFDGARDLIEGNHALVRGRVEVIGRYAGLCYLTGRLDAANRAAALIRSLYPDEVKAGVEAAAREFGRFVESGYAYREDFDVYLDDGSQVESWEKYRLEMGEEKTRLFNDSQFISHILFSQVKDLLSRRPEITAIVNCGSCFASFESRCAREFEDKTVVGYDRSAIATERNREHFRAPNLRFADGDFVSAVNAVRGHGEIVLTHTRLGALMQPNQLAALYEDCRRCGVSWILLVEGINYSESNGAYPDFSVAPGPTLWEGGRLLLHDYDHFLGQAGYAVEARDHFPATYHFRRNRFKEASTVFQAVLARRKTP